MVDEINFSTISRHVPNVQFENFIYDIKNPTLFYNLGKEIFQIEHTGEDIVEK